ncbi:hypothetical protein XNA1_4550013 [Xenorhabdus nematophila str. Anatoliense]|nr:hypothetical protein XNA1_4550013 [Xenorhabdus nematophila str. Anatoliense]
MFKNRNACCKTCRTNFTIEDGPVSRESVEYFKSDGIASKALEKGNWTQREYI